MSTLDPGQPVHPTQSGHPGQADPAEATSELVALAAPGVYPGQAVHPGHTIAEAAALLGVAEKTVRRRIRTGKLAAVLTEGPHGEEYRISPEALSTQDSPPVHPGPVHPPQVSTLDASPGVHPGQSAAPATGKSYQLDRTIGADGKEQPPNPLPTDREMLEAAWAGEQRLLADVAALRLELAGLRERAERVEDLRGELATVNRRLDEAEAARRQAEETRAQEAERYQVLLQSEQRNVEALAARLERIEQRALPSTTEPTPRPWWRFW